MSNYPLGFKTCRNFYCFFNSEQKMFFGSSKFLCLVLIHTPPCGRLADRNRNRNLTTATPKMGSKCFGKFFIKSLHFLLGRPYVNTNSLKSSKFLRKVNLHCRKCKNVQNSLLKQIFYKVLSLNKTSGLHNHISNAISKVCTSLV